MEKSEYDITQDYIYPIGLYVLVEYSHINKRNDCNAIKIIDDEFHGYIESVYTHYIVVRCSGIFGTYTKTILKKDLYLGICKIKVLS